MSAILISLLCISFHKVNQQFLERLRYIAYIYVVWLQSTP